jgi:SAM-dependent methyltransferase
MHVKFWFKTILYWITWGGYGYYRELRRHKVKGYQLPENEEKILVQYAEKSPKTWTTERDGIGYRDYASYDDYVAHQKAKFDSMIKKDWGLSNATVTEYRIRFHYRFRHLPRFLPHNAVILCLGARQGTEVEVLRDIGYSRAYGIDLNPGPNNPYVQEGDFMHLKEMDESVDMIYSNAIDHVFDLRVFLQENSRVLKKRGLALYDISLLEGKSFESACWKSDTTVFRLLLDYFSEVIKVEIEDRWKWFLLRSK